MLSLALDLLTVNSNLCVFQKYSDIDHTHTNTQNYMSQASISGAAVTTDFEFQ